MFNLIQGDARDVLKTMDAESVQCVVTSPPYWGLRDYHLPPTIWGGDPECDHDFEETARPGGQGSGESFRRDRKAGWKRGGRQPGFCQCGAWSGCLGLEPTPELYVEHMVRIFREVRRVLRKDGTLWLNMGDCYATGAGQGYVPGGGGQGNRWKRKMNNTWQPNRLKIPGLKNKDLVGMPGDLVRALRADGWWWRDEIVWHKPSTMPESMRDRCTRAHEFIFNLAKNCKSPLYWSHDDREYSDGVRSRPQPDYIWINRRNGIRGPTEPPDWRTATSKWDGKVQKLWRRKNLWRGSHYYYDQDAIREPMSQPQDSTPEDMARANNRRRSNSPTKRQDKIKVPGGWDTKTGGNGTIHRAGRSEAEYVQHRAPWVDHKGRDDKDDLASWGSKYGSATHPRGRNKRSVWTIPAQPFPQAHFATFPPRLIEPCILAGSRPGDVVLDPFAGAGTTGLVAQRLGRDFVGIELNPEYCEMARARIEEDMPLFKER